MMSDPGERLTELEAKIAFLEDANQQMSDLIYKLQQQVDQHVRNTARQIETLAAAQTSGDPADEVPPHY
ncbi:MAG: SlyX family protein [Gammaproteobacteria bacterium]|nr:SlyX family protein [Gammaproteobacteria bacterium]